MPTQAIGEMKAQVAVAASIAATADEQQLQRDLLNAMSVASQFKAAVANTCKPKGVCRPGTRRSGYLRLNVTPTAT